jgi:hypothetical protein
VSYIAHVEVVLNFNQILIEMKIITCLHHAFYNSWRHNLKVSFIEHVEIVLIFNQMLIKMKIITSLHHAFYISWRLFKVSYIAHVEVVLNFNQILIKMKIITFTSWDGSQSVIHCTCGGCFKL